MKMKKFNSACRLAVMFAVSLLVVGAYAFVDRQEDYEPRVGQPGKDVVWVPTPQELIDTMFEMANATPDDYVIDLGSGDGRMVITAAKMGIEALGIEYNQDLVALSKKSAELEGVSDLATFMEADIFETDFSRATVITMFLLPELNLRLRPRLLELEPGTRIVSNAFTMNEWIPDKKETLDDCSSWCTAYMWVIPAKVDGKWEASDGELTLDQEFQMITGLLTREGKETAVSGKVEGDRVRFTAADREYSGSIKDNTIVGVAKTGDQNLVWKATRK